MTLRAGRKQMASFVPTDDPQFKCLKLSREEAVRIIELLVSQLSGVGSMGCPDVVVNDQGYRMAFLVEK